MIDLSAEHITGTMVAYYYICHRKLWLFSKGLNMENVSGNADVIKGKMLHEERFSREAHKEIGFDNIKIDFLRFGDQVFVHEIKKSRKFEEAHIWQLKFYIYQLQLRSVNCEAGVIHYPQSMRKLDVVFTAEDRALLEDALQGIMEVQRLACPPPVLGRKVCNKCAYYDFCVA